MKTILVPTDFSDIARNAIDYAAEMAKTLNAKLILFHAYHVPTAIKVSPADLPSEREIERECMNALKKTEHAIHKKYGNKIAIERVCRMGLAVDEINEMVEDQFVDLIVMGTQGGGFITEKIFGSVTTSLMKKCKCPVLVIHNDTKFKALKHIVLAADYQELNGAVLKPLKTLVRAFGAHVHILNIVTEPEMVPSIKEAVNVIKLEHELEGVDHSFHSALNEDVFEGVNEFSGSGKADVVAMIPREHSVLWNLFHEPKTKRMAFHSNVPLLILR